MKSHTNRNQNAAFITFHIELELQEEYVAGHNTE